MFPESRLLDFLPGFRHNRGVVKNIILGRKNLAPTQSRPYISFNNHHITKAKNAAKPKNPCLNCRPDFLQECPEEIILQWWDMFFFLGQFLKRQLREHCPDKKIPNGEVIFSLSGYLPTLTLAVKQDWAAEILGFESVSGSCPWKMLIKISLLAHQKLRQSRAS